MVLHRRDKDGRTLCGEDQYGLTAVSVAGITCKKCRRLYTEVELGVAFRPLDKAMWEAENQSPVWWDEE